MADIPFDALQGGGDGILIGSGQSLIFGSAVDTPSGLGFFATSPVNISSSLATVLSLPGRRVTQYLFLQSLDTGLASLRVQLLVDGVIVMDQTEPGSIRNSVLILGSSLAPMSIRSNSSIEVRAQKSGSTAVQIIYCSVALL